MDKEKIKVLLARSLLEGHDMGVRMVASRFRDRGFEVVYIRFSDVKEVVKSAADEDVNVIGITTSSGNHIYIASQLMKRLAESNIRIPVIFGGVIPNVDIPKLLAAGVKRVFGPGSRPEEAVTFVSDLAKVQ